MFDYSFHWRSAFKALPDMLAGAWVTLETAALSMLLGTLIALLLTVMRQMQHPVPRHFANTWVSIARNTPSLFQIYVLYFGLGSLGLHVSSWIALLAGITFNNAGYLAENFRGGLKAVPETQIRAARSLGMSFNRILAKIVIPQALRSSVLPMTNLFIAVMLTTALGSQVPLKPQELTGVVSYINTRSLGGVAAFFISALGYLGTAFVVSHIGNYIDKKVRILR